MLIRLKISILNIFSKIEFIKIIFMTLFVGSDYAVKSLTTCRKNNIEKVLKYYGATIGINNHFKGSLLIDNAKISTKKLFENLIIGNNCYIGKSVYLDLADKIIIKDSVVIGAKVTITTHADVGNREMKKYFKRVSKEVLLQEYSWIGINATLLAGVKVGKFAVVGASSLVTSSVDDKKVVFGIPAEVYRSLDEDSDNRE